MTSTQRESLHRKYPGLQEEEWSGLVVRAVLLELEDLGSIPALSKCFFSLFGSKVVLKNENPSFWRTHLRPIGNFLEYEDNVFE